MKVGTFDVLKIMCERDLDIRLSTLDNIIQMQLVHKGKDTNLTIGFSGNVLQGIYNGKFVGGLLLADAAQFRQIKAELESAAPAVTKE